MRGHRTFAFTIAAFLISSAAHAGPLVLTGRLHHLRAGAQREWDNFPQQAEGPRLILPFQARPNSAEATLRLRQQDVRQPWKVMLNGKELARLPPDENDMVLYLPVPAGRLVNEENTPAIEQVGRVFPTTSASARSRSTIVPWLSRLAEASRGRVASNT